jgi:electron transport complex protein RnfB
MVMAKDIDAILPQTQCGECGYAGCLPYAQALAEGKASIDHCPPGGTTTLLALGQLLNIDSRPYLDKVKKTTRAPATAVIREDDCIGCTKCIKACPVDAIIGSAKHMHYILQHECTGCGLCIEPCPVDCIELQILDAPAYEPTTARLRYHAKKQRLLQDELDKQQRYQEKRQLVEKNQGVQEDKRAKQDYILQALARSQAKKERE